jgi:ribonuclease HI
MHASWGLRPILVRDLVRTTVLPCADYGVTSFLPIPMSALKPLEKINRSVSRCITGSFRTASLAALEKEAALLPVHLRLERDALNTVAYYLTLPRSHPIHPLLRNAIATTPKNPKLASILHYVERVPGIRWPPNVPACGQRLRARGVPRMVSTDGSPAELFDPTLGMEPIVHTYAAPWRDPLPVFTVILPKENALQALAMALSDERRRWATWFTDGSLLDGRAGGAAVRVENGQEMERIVVPLGNGQVCEGEMEGLVQATSKALQDNRDCILCVADSQAALRGILSAAPRSGQFRAIQYDMLVRDALLSRPHLTILNLWTPAHIGTVGNELADLAAKEATSLDPDPNAFVSLTSVRRHIHLQILESWNTMWKSSKTGGALRYIDKTPPSLTPIPLYSSSTLSRKTSSSISQLRTGPSFLNSHRFKSGFVNSPACEACGAAHETRAHFLLECPLWEPLRQPLHAASRSAELFGPLHVSPLLTHPKLLKALGKFVEDTGRFS